MKYNKKKVNDLDKFYGWKLRGVEVDEGGHG